VKCEQLPVDLPLTQELPSQLFIDPVTTQSISTTNKTEKNAVKRQTHWHKNSWPCLSDHCLPDVDLHVVILQNILEDHGLRIGEKYLTGMYEVLFNLGRLVEI